MRNFDACAANFRFYVHTQTTQFSRKGIILYTTFMYIVSTADERPPADGSLRWPTLHDFGVILYIFNLSSLSSLNFFLDFQTFNLYSCL